jgi:hypothetical protein
VGSSKQNSVVVEVLYAVCIRTSASILCGPTGSRAGAVQHGAHHAFYLDEVSSDLVRTRHIQKHYSPTNAQREFYHQL